MDLIEKIKAGCQVKKTVDWPGAEAAKVDIRVCNENDYLQASIATDRLFKDSRIALENINEYNSEKEIQLLFRAILDPETGVQLFKNITEFRTLLTPEVKDFFAEQLDALHEEFSPDLTTISDEDFDKLVQDVKKNAVEALSTQSNIYTLRKLSIFLASQLSN